MYKKIIISLLFIISINSKIVLAQNFETVILKNTKVEHPIKKTDKSKQIEKLSSSLDRLYRTYTEGKDYNQFAEQSELKLIEDRVVVTILPERDLLSANIDESNLKSFGARIQAKAKHSMRVEIPVNQLKNVATKVEGIGVITRPIKPIEYAITSEGVALMNADEWQSKGYEGSGVKVAVIDGGFDSLSEAQSNDDIPSSLDSFDFTGSGLQSGTPHGTAVAEAIFDVAPQAEFYLYRIGDYTDFENAKDTCVIKGIDIVNHSMGWYNAAYYDGSGAICDVANDAISNGILWVNAAGNDAEKHYRAVFVDDGSGYHDFSGNGTGNINAFGPAPGYAYNIPAGYTIDVFLNWDAYPVTDQDYDFLLVYNGGSGWSLVDYSEDWQDGDDPPTERISYVTQNQGYYGVVIEEFSTTMDHDFTIFNWIAPFCYRTDSSSVTDPASATDVVTVGAIGQDHYTSGPQESFSSQGPTTDGRIKPDVSAPDSCNSYAYGHWTGTSLSSPHTAGICALIKSRYPGYSNSDIKNYLYTNCTADLGTSGKDNIYGWGKVLLPDFDITVTSPNGGEDWHIGSSNLITWTSSGTSGGVQIEYSSDNGSSWANVIASIPDTGIYLWTIPDIPSDSCLVRITDTIGYPSDTSDAWFKISPSPTITVTSPNGGESWQVGNVHNITWTSVATSGGVNIEYSIDSAASWLEVITNMPDTGVYPWTLPDTPSDSCLIRITDTTGNPDDRSDSLFIIYPVSGVSLFDLPKVYSMNVTAIMTGNLFEVKYALPEKAEVQLFLYDIKGTKIQEFTEEHTAGFYSKNIDMRDKPAGVYFIRIKANTGAFTKTRKAILIK